MVNCTHNWPWAWPLTTKKHSKHWNDPNLSCPKTYKKLCYTKLCCEQEVRYSLYSLLKLFWRPFWIWLLEITIGHTHFLCDVFWKYAAHAKCQKLVTKCTIVLNSLSANRWIYHLKYGCALVLLSNWKKNRKNDWSHPTYPPHNHLFSWKKCTKQIQVPTHQLPRFTRIFYFFNLLRALIAVYAVLLWC